MIQALKLTASKNKPSAFAVDNHKTKVVKFNDIDMKPSTHAFYLVTQHFDFDEDLKMKTDAIMYRYLLDKIASAEHLDTVSTLKIMLEDLTFELKESLDDDDLDNIELFANTLEPKTLIKLISPKITCEDDVANGFDLDYEESIRLQLSIINASAKLDLKKTVIIFLQLPLLTDALLAEIKNASPNIKWLVDVPDMYYDDLDDILFITENHTIDMASDLDIHDKLTLELENVNSIEETKAIINQYLNTDNPVKKPQIRDLLR